MEEGSCKIRNFFEEINDDDEKNDDEGAWDTCENTYIHVTRSQHHYNYLALDFFSLQQVNQHFQSTDISNGQLTCLL